MVVLSALSKLKDFIVWSWTYLWAFWFLLVSFLLVFVRFRRHLKALSPPPPHRQVVFVLYYLRGPLKIGENVAMAALFLSSLTPKFYVALTGTSSLISGLILIFEWWYYRR